MMRSEVRGDDIGIAFRTPVFFNDIEVVIVHLFAAHDTLKIQFPCNIRSQGDGYSSRSTCAQGGILACFETQPK